MLLKPFSILTILTQIFTHIHNSSLAQLTSSLRIPICGVKIILLPNYWDPGSLTARDKLIIHPRQKHGCKNYSAKSCARF